MNILRLLNLTCRDATRLISDSMDRDLSRLEHLGLRLHLFTCRICNRYRAQLLLLRRVIRDLVHTGKLRLGLTPSARHRIRSAIIKHIP